MFVVYVFIPRGINYVLSALVFNVVPTIFEVSLVTGIMVITNVYNYYLLLVYSINFDSIIFRYVVNKLMKVVSNLNSHLAMQKTSLCTKIMIGNKLTHFMLYGVLITQYSSS